MIIHPNNQSTNVEQFISGLIKLKGFDNLTPDVHDAIVKDLQERLDEYIMTKTISRFSPEDLTAYEALLDENKPLTQLQQFATEHIPDYETFLASTLIEFQDAYLTPKEEQA